MLKQNQTLAHFNKSKYNFSTRIYNNLMPKERFKIIELCDLWLNNDYAPVTLTNQFHLKEKKVRSVLRWFENEMKRYQNLAA